MLLHLLRSPSGTSLTLPHRRLCPLPAKADIRPRRATSSYDPGCVKTRNKITCAPQKNRTRGSGEFIMLPRTLAHINVAPEPCPKSFSHDQDPNRTLPHRSDCPVRCSLSGAFSYGLFNSTHCGSCILSAGFLRPWLLTRSIAPNTVTGINPPADATLSAFVCVHSPRSHKCLFRRCEGIQKTLNYYIYMSGRCSTKSFRF